ncbi:MAG: aminotransferase class V-fold PLP-dependent enzyme [Verrucomicrobia bacterium]|nr:aminotransferase class V-fold PLP-dependent enzyme [Verrucomicrobiota bacterium]
MVEDLSLTHPAGGLAIWPLDPDVVFLNHGSFGSCPRPVLEFQQQVRARMERQPVQFFVRDLEKLLDDARETLAEFLGADAGDLVFVTNATAGVNAVLRSLRFERGDELLVTDHEYNACRNALEFAAAQWGARVTAVAVPFPVRSADDIVAAVMERVTPRTRLALFDHVTSQTGLVMPIQRLAEELAARGVETLVDGAHAPGMLPLRLREIGAAYYTGNCHKWLCAPKGAGFLVVRRDRQALIRPLAISHGANTTRTDRSRFQIEFGWTGTCDPSAWLSVSESLRVVGSQLPGGWPEVKRRNRALALAGRKVLCEALGIAPPCPEELIGSLASVPIPDAADSTAPTSPLYADPLQDTLRLRHRIEAPIIPWPAPPKRLLRISAQLYNSVPQYRRLAEALKTELRV